MYGVRTLCRMSKLQSWMDSQGENDLSLAQKVGVSRVQMSRIRRGINGASKTTALELERVTGIAWYTFIEPVTGQSGAAA